MALLDFMYNGEVNVDQDMLNNFLRTAQDLKVTGLTQGPDMIQQLKELETHEQIERAKHELPIPVESIKVLVGLVCLSAEPAGRRLGTGSP